MDRSQRSTVGTSAELEEAIVGCLLGTAVGDAFGLCCEGLSPRRLRKLYPRLDGPRLLFGKGMVSDDTEHACMTAQALIESGGETVAFRNTLAKRLRVWLLGLPAGIGFATLRACIKLWLGVPSDRSGVYSAGNGPAMRSPILGVVAGQDIERLRVLVRASTRLTHTDPKAEYGATAAALAAYAASQQRESTPRNYYRTLETVLGTEAGELLILIAKAVESAETGRTTQAFASELGLENGVGGYIYHTIPVVLHAWFRHPDDYRAAITEIVACGGDTDTTAAILGGIIGAHCGKAGIPGTWRDALWEWPRTATWMERLGSRLAETTSQGASQRPPKLPLVGVLLRNLVFLVVVLAHGFRRLLPPY